MSEAKRTIRCKPRSCLIGEPKVDINKTQDPTMNQHHKIDSLTSISNKGTGNLYRRDILLLSCASWIGYLSYWIKLLRCPFLILVRLCETCIRKSLMFFLKEKCFWEDMLNEYKIPTQSKASYCDSITMCKTLCTGTWCFRASRAYSTPSLRAWKNTMTLFDASFRVHIS